MRSAIGMPPARTGTSSPGDACAVSRPARACATRSYAGASASGPAGPKELTRPTTSAGWAAWTSSQPSPNRDGTLAREVVQRRCPRCRSSARARREPLRGLEIDDDRALPAVQRDEVAPDPGRDRHDVAVPVAGRRLDLDHVGAQVGEEHPAERPGDVLRVLDDPHAFERKASSRTQARAAR